MYSFIPEEDRDTFEKFLRKLNLEPISTPEAQPQAMKQGGKKRRGGHNRPVSDIDKFLHDIDSQMDSVLEDTTTF